MVNIICTKTHRGYEELHLRGHAEYNVGNDIVCAAISALVYSLVQTLIDIAPQAIKDYQLESGADIEVNPVTNKTLQLKIDMAFQTVIKGLTLICKQYPNNANIEIQNI